MIRGLLTRDPKKRLGAGHEGMSRAKHSKVCVFEGTPFASKEDHHLGGLAFGGSRERKTPDIEPGLAGYTKLKGHAFFKHLCPAPQKRHRAAQPRAGARLGEAARPRARATLRSDQRDLRGGSGDSLHGKTDKRFWVGLFLKVPILGWFLSGKQQDTNHLGVPLC